MVVNVRHYPYDEVNPRTFCQRLVCNGLGNRVFRKFIKI